MQASIESTGNLERRLSFSLPEDRLQSHIVGRLGEIARTTRIKGFRPGKVPAKVIEQRFGQQVRAEALDGLLRETFDSAIREQSLQLAGNPRLEPAGEGQLDWVATFEVVPDFGDIDVAKLTVVRHTADVNDADIDQMVDNLRMQRRTFQVVERGAQVGDRVALETWSQAGEERMPAEGIEKGATLIGSGVMFSGLLICASPACHYATCAGHLSADRRRPCCQYSWQPNPSWTPRWPERRPPRMHACACRATQACPWRVCWPKPFSPCGLRPPSRAWLPPYPCAALPWSVFSRRPVLPRAC